jgi:hypothetical protein
MANDDLYRRLLGIASDPPGTSLSGLMMGLAQPAVVSTPAPVPTPTGIRFQDSQFSEPTAFGTAWLPKSSGIYVILGIDWTGSPRPYRPIYFGKAVDLAGRVGASHEKYGEWCRAAGGADKLYVAYHLMLGSDAHRAAIEESLIRHHSPECNKTFNYLSDLLGC